MLGQCVLRPAEEPFYRLRKSACGEIVRPISDDILPKGLILNAEGTMDAVAAGIVRKHLDGELEAYYVKPQKTKAATLDAINLYRNLQYVERTTIIIDGDDKDPQHIPDKWRKRLTVKGGARGAGKTRGAV